LTTFSSLSLVTHATGMTHLKVLDMVTAQLHVPAALHPVPNE